MKTTQLFLALIALFATNVIGAPAKHHQNTHNAAAQSIDVQETTTQCASGQAAATAVASCSDLASTVESTIVLTSTAQSAAATHTVHANKNHKRGVCQFLGDKGCNLRCQAQGHQSGACNGGEICDCSAL